MTNEIDDYVGKRLRRRRRLLGLTQQSLGEMVGIRFQQIQKYECGANRVSAARLFELAEALGVPVQYFYEGLSERDMYCEFRLKRPILLKAVFRLVLRLSPSYKRA